MNNRQNLQTPLDQMVTTENSQMLKAMIPYLPSAAQQMLSIYTKMDELTATIQLFSSSPTMQICSNHTNYATPSEILNDIRQYCNGEKKQQIDQINNLFVMLEMMSVMKSS